MFLINVQHSVHCFVTDLQSGHFTKLKFLNSNTNSHWTHHKSVDSYHFIKDHFLSGTGS